MVSNVLNHQDMLLDDHKNVFSSPGPWDDGFLELGFWRKVDWINSKISCFLNNAGKPLSRPLVDSIHSLSSMLTCYAPQTKRKSLSRAISGVPFFAVQVSMELHSEIHFITRCLLQREPTRGQGVS